MVIRLAKSPNWVGTNPERELFEASKLVNATRVVTPDVIEPFNALFETSNAIICVKAEIVEGNVPSSVEPLSAIPETNFPPVPQVTPGHLQRSAVFIKDAYSTGFSMYRSLIA